MYLLEKLYQLRKKEGLTQEKLAEIIGVSRQAVSKWESGQSFPETDKLIKLSKLFNIALDDLIQEESEKTNKLDLKDKDNEEVDEFLILGGYIVGIVIGIITGNFIWSTMGAFIGLGMGYIISTIKKK